MGDVRGEPLLGEQLALQRRRHGVQRGGDRGHLVVRARRVLGPRVRTGVVHARVQIARADPPGHPGRGVQPPRHPRHRERAHQQRRPDRQPRRPQDRPVQARDRARLLRVVDRHGQRPVTVGGPRRPHHGAPRDVGDHRAAVPGHRQLPQLPRQPRRIHPGTPPERVPGLVPLGRLRQLLQRLIAGLAHGLVGHLHVHQDAEQGGQRAAHHRDEGGGLHRERPGPLGERASHPVLAEGEADGRGAWVRGPVRSISSWVRSMARWSRSQVHWRRYS